MAQRAPQREDRIDDYYDEEFNRRAQNLRDQEESTGRQASQNSSDGSGSSLASSKDASKNIDAAKEKEENPSSGWANKYTGGNSGNNRSFVGKLKGQKKKGPLALLVLVFGGGGLLFTSFFSPALLLVHVKNMFLNDLSDVSPAQNVRSSALMRNKIKGVTATASICTNKITVRCKFSTFSNREVRKFERAGFTVERQNSRMPGRNIIQSMTFETNSGEKITIRNPQEMRNFARTPEGRSALNRAFNPKAAAFIDKSFNSMLLRKFKINKASKLSGNDKKKVQESFDKSVGADEETKSKEGGRFNGSVEEGRSVAKKAAGVSSLTGQIVCEGYNTSRKIVNGVKATQAASFAAFAMTFLTETDKMIAGKGDPEIMSALGDQMTSVDNRKEVDGKPNPNYGKSPTDAQGYRLAAYGDVGKLDSSASQYVLGGGVLLGTLTKIISAPSKIPGGKTSLKVACKALDGAGIIQILKCAVTGGVICGIVAAIGIGGGVALGILFDDFVKLLIERLGKVSLDANTVGPDVGNAMFAGSSAVMSGMAGSAGMMPANKASMQQYFAATDGERKLQIAADVYDARSDPFNVYNQYSFLGSIAQPVNESLFSQPTAVSRVANLVSFIPSAFGTIGTASAQYNMPVKPYDSNRFSQCEDPQLKEVNVDGDAFCNIRYSMSSQELGFDPDKNTAWLVKNEYINEETGEPASTKNGEDYKNFLEYCVNRVDPMGSTAEPITTGKDEGWITGSKCTEKSEKMSRFRTFTMDLNMQNIIDDTSPEAEGSSGNTSPPGDGTAPDPTGGDKNSWYKDTSNVPCGPGTQDMGIQETFYIPVTGQNKYKIRLCALSIRDTSGINPGGKAWVNSSVSESWQKLINDAQAAGFSPSANTSFRSPSWQCTGGGNCTPSSNPVCAGYQRVACVGWSNHGAGFAIDFAGTAGGSAFFRWLQANSRKYGFGLNPTESWHWDKDFYYTNPSNRLGR